MVAGPLHVAAPARIVGVDAQGSGIVLRQGNNGFTRQGGDPKVPASRSNEASCETGHTFNRDVTDQTNEECQESH
jgi:hypothetical protein